MLPGLGENALHVGGGDGVEAGQAFVQRRDATESQGFPDEPKGADLFDAHLGSNRSVPFVLIQQIDCEEICPTRGAGSSIPHRFTHIRCDVGLPSSAQPTRCKGLAPRADILYCSSFSKSLSPGLRIGWIAAGKHHARVEYLKYVTSIACSTVPQLTVAELLASGRYERYLRNVRGKYQSAVARMSDAVMKTFPAGTRISQPQGGFMLWVELPEGTDSMALARRALQNGVSVAPGPLFSASGKFGNFIRLSCARVWDARLERTLVTLAKLI